MRYLKLDLKNLPKTKFPRVTVHGRFQPPLHVNHWKYIQAAFKIADKVTVLITNPKLEEALFAKARHRVDPKHNPFSYKARAAIFKSFFGKMGIPKSRYEFKPFNITDKKDWKKVLRKNVPNVINTYGSPWSAKKLKEFKKSPYPVIHLSIPKVKPVSGKNIREILSRHLSQAELKRELAKAGYMKKALPGLFEVLKTRVP